MPEELKDLIEKIQEEGVLTAEKKAREIEEEARKKAEAIIEQAKRDAKRTEEESKEKAARAKKSGEDSIKQAARDMMLNLRKEIHALLDRIITARVQEALTPGELSKILASLIKESRGKEKGEIVVSLKKSDVEEMEKSYLKDLKDKAEGGIVLRSSDDIRGGFTISYDKGRSYFDFTDKALAEYISLRLRPGVAALLNETVETDT